MPWKCDKRGDKVMVFDGMYRGTKGKVIGFENSHAFIQVDKESQGRRGLSCAARHIVKPEKAEVARFNAEILAQPFTAPTANVDASDIAKKIAGEPSDAESDHPSLPSVDPAPPVGQAREAASPAESPDEVSETAEKAEVKDVVKAVASPTESLPSSAGSGQNEDKVPTAAGVLEKEEGWTDGQEEVLQSPGTPSDID